MLSMPRPILGEARHASRNADAVGLEFLSLEVSALSFCVELSTL